jgi:hypothetical protein
MKPFSNKLHRLTFEYSNMGMNYLIKFYELLPNSFRVFRSFSRIETILNPFLGPTSTKMSLKFLTYRHNGLPLARFDPCILRWCVNHSNAAKELYVYVFQLLPEKILAI